MYNFEEFKKWLAQQSEEKREAWTPQHLAHFVSWPEAWTTACQTRIFFGGKGTVHQVGLEWLETVDARERERELKGTICLI